MRTRWPITCEKCKKHMPTGSQATRVHGRLWHTSCAMSYLRTKQDRKERPAPLPKRMRAKS